MKGLVRWTVFAGIVVGLGLSFGGGVLIAQQPVTIGAIYPLTGANSSPGIDMKRGSELALEEINAAGGVLGRPLQILFEDTESNPQAGIEAVHKLVEVDKVPLILGAYASGTSLPTGEYTNSQGVIQISVASTSPALRDIGPYFFNVMGLDDVLGRILAEGAMKDTGATRWGSIVVNNPFGVGIELATCGYVEEHGGECVSKIRYERFKTDYRAELEALFRANPEAIFFTAYGTESRLILKQAYELGLTPPKGWWADYMTMWVNEVKDIPEVAEGIRGWIIGGDPAEDYVAAYREKYGEDPLTTFGGYAFDATWIAAMAINFAGTTDPDKVRIALPIVAKRYEGVTGDKDMDEDGMQVREEVRWRIYQDGQLVPYEIGGE
jgi:branched-chain amino acid transport system substrate-binding protein